MMNVEAPSRRILIVEDEALVALELEAYLTEAGFEVVGTADDLESALEVVEQQTADLALVDIQLARGSNGREVARELKARGVPALFATGNCPGDASAEAIGCLHKPVNSAQLIEAVSAAVAVVEGGRPPRLPSSMHLY